MSATRLESAIMDRAEAGMDRADIAAELGCAPRTVRSVIQYLQPGQAERQMSSQVLAIASGKLVAAIARHHPERLSNQPARGDRHG